MLVVVAAVINLHHQNHCLKAQIYDSTFANKSTHPTSKVTQVRLSSTTNNQYYKKDSFSPSPRDGAVSRVRRPSPSRSRVVINASDLQPYNQGSIPGHSSDNHSVVEKLARVSVKVRDETTVWRLTAPRHSCHWTSKPYIPPMLMYWQYWQQLVDTYLDGGLLPLKTAEKSKSAVVK